MQRDARLFLGASAFCAVLALIYNMFSHGVHSPYMTLLFLWPLALGAAPAFLLGRASDAHPRILPGTTAWRLYGEGIEALTAASLLRGIFEIAGTASIFVNYLMYAGWGLIAAGVILYGAGLCGSGSK